MEAAARLSSRVSTESDRYLWRNLRHEADLYTYTSVFRHYRRLLRIDVRAGMKLASLGFTEATAFLAHRQAALLRAEKQSSLQFSTSPSWAIGLINGRRPFHLPLRDRLRLYKARKREREELDRSFAACQWIEAEAAA